MHKNNHARLLVKQSLAWSLLDKEQDNFLVSTGVFFFWFHLSLTKYLLKLPNLGLKDFKSTHTNQVHDERATFLLHIMKRGVWWCDRVKHCT